MVVARRALTHQRSAVIMGVRAMRSWSTRRWLVAALAAALTATVMGVPTGIVRTGLYTRMTAVTWWDYPIWALSAVLVGLTAATYVRIAGAHPVDADPSRRTLGATLLATFAVGCPICNKLVVAAIGVSGALSYWGLRSSRSWACRALRCSRQD